MEMEGGGMTSEGAAPARLRFLVVVPEVTLPAVFSGLGAGGGGGGGMLGLGLEHTGLFLLASVKRSQGADD